MKVKYEQYFGFKMIKLAREKKNAMLCEIMNALKAFCTIGCVCEGRIKTAKNVADTMSTEPIDSFCISLSYLFDFIFASTATFHDVKLSTPSWPRIAPTHSKDTRIMVSGALKKDGRKFYIINLISKHGYHL
jgi:hypothetical protein